jgi:hypothetical protein
MVQGVTLVLLGVGTLWRLVLQVDQLEFGGRVLMRVLGVVLGRVLGLQHYWLVVFFVIVVVVFVLVRIVLVLVIIVFVLTILNYP